MAILLTLDRQQYFQGAVRLFRGDAWNIAARVVDQVGGVALQKDLTGCGATAYFPATGGDPIASVVTLSNAPAGEISIALADTLTPQVQLNENGIQLYVVVDGPVTGNPYTAQMTEPDLQVVDRVFTQF